PAAIAAARPHGTLSVRHPRNGWRAFRYRGRGNGSARLRVLCAIRWKATRDPGRRRALALSVSGGRRGEDLRGTRRSGAAGQAAGADRLAGEALLLRDVRA